jgi:hypothetical protein
MKLTVNDYFRYVKLTPEYIRGIGNFLATYHSDLTYIERFQCYKRDSTQQAEYILKGKGTFKQFLNDFRIARNIPDGKTGKLLALTLEWIKTGANASEVDDFAEFLRKRKMSHFDKTPYSLASKILFLNDPVNIVPNDILARNAVGCKDRQYSKYKECFDSFLINHSSEFKSVLKEVEPLAMIIEKDFKKLTPIKTIRFNRFVDKMLWTIGK